MSIYNKYLCQSNTESFRLKSDLFLELADHGLTPFNELMSLAELEKRYIHYVPAETGTQGREPGFWIRQYRDPATGSDLCSKAS